MKPRNFIPGPTNVNMKVRKALSRKVISPDYDEQFDTFFSSIKDKLSHLVPHGGEVVVIAGEAMVALEAACANLINNDSRVLCINNGVFGAGFASLCLPYSKHVDVFDADWKCGIDVVALEQFLKGKNFAVATLVAVDTPTGVCNDVETICRMLKKHNIMTIVDAVSAIAVESFNASDVDLLLGGSQKGLSAPTGLGFIYLSAVAKAHILNNKAQLPYYLDLRNYFTASPYTYSRELLNALDVAIDTRVEIVTMARFAAAVRKALTSCGIKLFLNKDYSNGVTAFYPPDGKVESLVHALVKKGFYLAPPVNSDLGIIRIGHMGYNCNYSDFIALFKELGRIYHLPLAEAFKNAF